MTFLPFFGDDVLNYLYELTNLYAKQCHRKEYLLAVIGSLPILVNKKQMFCLVYSDRWERRFLVGRGFGKICAHFFLGQIVVYRSRMAPH
jgi:hypothetical protein